MRQPLTFEYDAWAVFLPLTKTLLTNQKGTEVILSPDWITAHNLAVVHYAKEVKVVVTVTVVPDGTK